MALASSLVGTGVRAQPTPDALRRRALLNNVTGPAKERIGPLSRDNPRGKFVACFKAQANSRAEGHTSDPEGS
jgi:hypothetical protein